MMMIVENIRETENPRPNLQLFVNLTYMVGMKNSKESLMDWMRITFGLLLKPLSSLQALSTKLLFWFFTFTASMLPLFLVFTDVVSMLFTESDVSS